MKTLDLKEAALFLKMTPEGVRRKVTSGEIPGAKPGKRWCFFEDDLVRYIKSIYAIPAKTSQVLNTNRRIVWHSAKEVMCGGLESDIKEEEYNKALGLKTK